MTRYELFSMRQKRQRGQVPDVYQYDVIPAQLRVQVIHIWGDTLGHDDPRAPGANRSGQIYAQIHDRLCREWGCFTLGEDPYASAENKLRAYLGGCGADSALDIIELSFRCINALLQDHNERYSLGSTIGADEAIAELNERFRWHSVGYQYESGFMVRVDSQFLHSEVIRPALFLLAGAPYAGANAEFLNAFGHYRQGRTKECLTECLKAFESTMKAICTKRKWVFRSTDAAKDLIEVCLKQGLIPPLIQSHIGGVRSALESGIPTVRNRLSGHGQGATVVDVPLHYAS